MRDPLDRVALAEHVEEHRSATDGTTSQAMRLKVSR